jgi:hypothetical protein
MTDSVCTAYESRKKRNDSSSLKGIVLTATYDIMYCVFYTILCTNI